MRPSSDRVRVSADTFLRRRWNDRTCQEISHSETATSRPRDLLYFIIIYLFFKKRTKNTGQVDYYIDDDISLIAHRDARV